MKRILLIDHPSVFRDMLASVLERSGYGVLTAADLAETSARLGADATDLVILNVASFEGEYLTIAQHVRRRTETAGIPIMVLAATNDHASILAAAKLGVRDYLIRAHLRLDTLLARIHSRLAPPAPPGAIVTHGAMPAPDRHTDKAKARPPLALARGPSGPPTGAPADGAPSSGTPPAGVPPAGMPPAGMPQFADRHAGAHHAAPPTPLTPAEIESRLQSCGELKALSPVASQVLKLTNSAECSLGRISSAIKRDQAMSLKILRLANSPIYTRGEPVESVQKAVMRIGMQQIRQAVLNLAVVDQFDADDPEGEIRSGSFWEHSIACGLVAAELTRCTGGDEAAIDAAFTVGLLHDVGRMVLAQQLGPHYSAVVRAARAGDLPLERAETQGLGLNHADIMERILVAWRFPRHLIQPIVLHHLSMGNIRQLAPSELRPIAILALANRLVHAMLLGSSGNLTIYPTHELARGLKISDKLIREIEDRVPGQANEIKASMLSTSNERHWTGVRDGVMREVPRPFRPLFIGKDGGIDAFRMLCDTLTDPGVVAASAAAGAAGVSGVAGGSGGSGGPNIAVVHVTHTRDQAALGQLLRDAQARRGVEPLPVVIISPAGEHSLEEKVLAGHRVERLSSPMTVQRFIKGVQTLLVVPDAVAVRQVA